MLDLIHLTTMSQSLKTQYQNATNISARIRLHRDYSLNQQGWFPWLFDQVKLSSGMRVLEIGCGNGELWAENKDRLPANIQIVLSDISEGMVQDARKKIGQDQRFSYLTFDAQAIPFAA